MKGFPVEVTNQASSIPKDAYQGGVNNNAYSLKLVTRTELEAATNTSIGHLYALNAGFAPQPGKAAVITAFTFTSTATITIQGRVGIPVGPLNGVNVPERVFTAVVEANHVVRIPVNWVIRNGQQCTVYALNFMDDNDTEAWIGAHPEVYYITDDYNYNARLTMAVIGTSITNGSGPSSTVNMYITKFKQYLRSLGGNVRYELYGISGSTSTQHSQYFDKGAYDVMANGLPPDIVVLEMAVNDASSGMVVETSIANYTRLITMFLNYPGKDDIRVLVLGATPLESNTASANAEALDDALLELVNQFKESASYNERVFFIKLSGSFNRLTASNYAATDTPGSRIHPSDQGSAAIASTLNTWADSDDGQVFVNWTKG